MVNLGDDYLKEKRGWSQRKVDILRLVLIIGLYLLFIYIAFNMVWTDQQCRMLLPSGDIIQISLKNGSLPPINDIIVQINTSNCVYVTQCKEQLVCNITTPIQNEPCWSNPMC